MPVCVYELSHVLCLPLAEWLWAPVGLLAGPGAGAQAAPLVVPVAVGVDANASKKEGVK